jgi:predicted permease
VWLQAASLLGALLILAAYAAHQAGRMGRDTASYNLINAAGALLLLVVAIRARQVGFILLEGTWTLISLAALRRAVRSGAPR